MTERLANADNIPATVGHCGGTDSASASACPIRPPPPRHGPALSISGSAVNTQPSGLKNTSPGSVNVSEIATRQQPGSASPFVWDFSGFNCVNIACESHTNDSAHAAASEAEYFTAQNTGAVANSEGIGIGTTAASAEFRSQRPTLPPKRPPPPRVSVEKWKPVQADAMEFYCVLVANKCPYDLYIIMQGKYLHQSIKSTMIIPACTECLVTYGEKYDKKFHLKIADSDNPKLAYVFWETSVTSWCKIVVTGRKRPTIIEPLQVLANAKHAEQRQAMLRLIRYTSFYHVLQIERDATQAQIEHHYLHLAKMYHPKANAHTLESLFMFQKVLEAYLVLSDKDRRTEYNRYLDYRGGITTDRYWTALDTDPNKKNRGLKICGTLLLAGVGIIVAGGAIIITGGAAAPVMTAFLAIGGGMIYSSAAGANYIASAQKDGVNNKKLVKILLRSGIAGAIITGLTARSHREGDTNADLSESLGDSGTSADQVKADDEMTTGEENQHMGSNYEAAADPTIFDNVDASMSDTALLNYSMAEGMTGTEIALEVVAQLMMIGAIATLVVDLTPDESDPTNNTGAANAEDDTLTDLHPKKTSPSIHTKTNHNFIAFRNKLKPKGIHAYVQVEYADKDGNIIEKQALHGDVINLPDSATNIVVKFGVKRFPMLKNICDVRAWNRRHGAWAEPLAPQRFRYATPPCRTYCLTGTLFDEKISSVTDEHCQEVPDQ